MSMSTDIARSTVDRRLAREERRLAERLREAQLPGQLAAAEIESGAFAAHVAMTHATMLSAAEGRALEYAPLGERRYQLIGDSFAGFCAEKLNLLAFRSVR